MKCSEGDDEAPVPQGTGRDEPMLEFYAQVGAWQHGPLYEDLARLPKGRRRAERFRTLAYLGVLVEQERRGGEARPGTLLRPAPAPASSSAGGIFDDPLPE
ncbi:MAG: hypothetical protein KIT35_00815 [Piscinibacter sp.]|uniref:hypothetical protein n=1 Tax=Piscinibacter sp. TaxID=1903157 RepID=UPI00258483B7|nr:hypothetical protein [Piscinibacter sp.]MCW5662351.1 hypothetical protein [Piscinibacter sp.]